MKPDFDSNLVSIITPVYNSERFIAETIDSVIKQSFCNWELILIDDCSSDTSPEILQQYAGLDSRIKPLRLDENMGAAVARNKGIEQAGGRYIAFVDADDLWEPDKLALQLEHMRKNKAGICFTAIEMIDESGAVVKEKRKVKPKIGYRYLLTNTMIACSSVVVDREIAGDFRMPLVRRGQDYATWLMLMRGGLPAYGIDKPLTRYRLVSNSISSNKFVALKRTWNIYRQQEHLDIVRSAFYFCLYTLNAIKKYYF